MTTKKKEAPIIQKKTGKIEFRRDKDGNLYAVKNGKTISRIETSGGDKWH